MARRVLSFTRDSRLRGALQGLGALLIVSVLAFAIYNDRDQFQRTTFSIDYGMTAVAFVLWLSSYVLFALGWNLVLRGIGSPVDWWSASRVFFLSQGLKYIPGSVVYAVGRVYMAQEMGVRAVSAAVGFALESLLALATALLVFFVLLPLGIWPDLPVPLMLGSFVGVVAILVAVPVIIRRLASFWANSGAVGLSYRTLALLCGFYIGIWLVVGLACYASLRALGSGFNVGFFQLLGLYTLSWAAGMVAVFAPGGVGVRDGLLILLLSRFVPLPLAAMGAAVLRVQTLIVEGVLAFVALKLQR